METADRFAFGVNWRKFNATVTDSQRATARESLSAWFGDLRGKRFLDVGAGSGLFAVAASELGADVTAFDFDPSHEGIDQGDILDHAYTRSLGQFDAVYCWGVLPFTGDTKLALLHVTELVDDGGWMWVTLYTPPNNPGRAIAVKRLYNRLPNFMKPLMRVSYGWLYLAYRQARWHDARRYVRDYSLNMRGMSYWRDVEDWVGGWPVEFTPPEEARAIIQGCGLEIVSTIDGEPGGMVEYLARRSGH